VVGALQEQLENPEGTHFYTYFERIAHRKEVVREEWVGFWHNVPVHPPEMKAMYHTEIDATRFLQSETWAVSRFSCKGLFVLSDYLGRFFRDRVDVPVDVLYHPMGVPGVPFSPERFLANQNRMIVTVGHWMRRFKAIEHLRVKNYKVKALQRCGVGDYLYEGLDKSIVVLPRKTDEEFDWMMSENLVFLNFYDASANNTVVECIGGNTPLLVNPVPAVVEYLGEKYPLYYNNFDEASWKADNLDLVVAAHQYLKMMDKRRFQLDTFIDDFVNSSVYVDLPVNRRPKLKML
jgi:hypothetical protein